MPTINYTAHPTLSRFHHSNAFVRGIIGPVGSGKSTACCVELLVRASQQKIGPDGKRKTRWLIVRNTSSQLKDTSLKTFFQIIPESLGVWKQSEMTFHMKQGDIDAEFMFRPLDRPQDIARVLSLEITGAFINESREINKTIVDAIQGRIGRYPSKIEGGPSWSGLWMDTNPPSQDSWWYRVFEEERPEDWELFHQPSAIGGSGENLENLPPNYYTTNMSGKSEEYLRIYRDGLYGWQSTGRPVYPEFNDTAHVVPEDKMLIVKSEPYYLGFDFGLNPSALFAQKVNGHWNILDEICTDGMGAERFVDLLKEKMNTTFAGMEYEAWGDPAGSQRSQVDENTPFLMLKSKGIAAKPTYTNDPIIRREAVARNLTKLAMDGTPVIRVSTKCKMFRKGMAGRFEMKRIQLVGEDRFKDTPDKGIYSHICDSGGYLFVGAGEGNVLIGKSKNHKYEQIDYPKLAIA